MVIKEDLYKNDSIKDLKKEYKNEIEKLEEASIEYMGESDLKIPKTETPAIWKNLAKQSAYPYEYFNSIDDYQKPVENLKKKVFFKILMIFEKYIPEKQMS